MPHVSTAKKKGNNITWSREGADPSFWQWLSKRRRQMTRLSGKRHRAVRRSNPSPPSGAAGARKCTPMSGRRDERRNSHFRVRSMASLSRRL
eukprot:707708-Rhodomonas_salina.7